MFEIEISFIIWKGKSSVLKTCEINEFYADIDENTIYQKIPSFTFETFEKCLNPDNHNKLGKISWSHWKIHFVESTENVIDIKQYIFLKELNLIQQKFCYIHRNMLLPISAARSVDLINFIFHNLFPKLLIISK